MQIQFLLYYSVNNVLNIYGTMILITITGVSTFIIINHYKDIYKKGKEDGAKLARGLVPKEWFVLLGLTIICVFLPFVKSQALRFEFCHVVNKYQQLTFLFIQEFIS